MARSNSPSSGLSIVVLATALSGLLALGACATAPRGSSAPAVGGVDYLHGVDTPYSVHLDRLGDRDLLGQDSVMREAMIAGDDRFFVAATAFRVEGVITVDLVLVNHSGQDRAVRRDELHVVDAAGRWLPSLDAWPEGKRYGLRGSLRREPTVPVYAMPDRGLEGTFALQRFAQGGDRGTTPRKTVVEHPPQRRPVDERDRVWRVDAPEAEDHFEGALRAVRIPDGEGRVFWGYFEAGEVQYPLSVVLMNGDEQLVYRFED